MRIQRQREAFAFRLGMAEEDYRAHVAHIDKHLTDLVHNHVETRTMPEYSRGIATRPDRVTGKPKEVAHWNKERRAQHQQIVRHFYDKMMQSNTPQEGKAIIMGGLGGAGKGYAASRPDIPLDMDKYFTINPDDVKEYMARNGMIPKTDHLSPMEATGLAHEEASDIAKRVAALAYRQKRNINWDITMASPGSVAGRINTMRKLGYNQVDGAFVDAPPDAARQRVEKRHREQEEPYRDNGGRGGDPVPGIDPKTGEKRHMTGGRWVPSELTQHNYPTPGSGKLSKNAEIFDQLRPMFDNTLDIDSSQDAAHGGPRVRNHSGIRWKDGHFPTGEAFPAWQPTGGGAAQVAACRRLYARLMQAGPGSGISVKDLIDDYRDGRLGYSELVDELASFDYSDPSVDERQATGGSWGNIYERSEQEPDDNSFFWVEAAVDDGTLDTGQVEQILDAVHAYHSQQGGDFVRPNQADNSDDDDYGDQHR